MSCSVIFLHDRLCWGTCCYNRAHLHCHILSMVFSLSFRLLVLHSHSLSPMNLFGPKAPSWLICWKGRAIWRRSFPSDFHRSDPCHAWIWSNRKESCEWWIGRFGCTRERFTYVPRYFLIILFFAVGVGCHYLKGRDTVLLSSCKFFYFFAEVRIQIYFKIRNWVKILSMKWWITPLMRIRTFRM